MVALLHVGVRLGVHLFSQLFQALFQFGELLVHVQIDVFRLLRDDFELVFEVGDVFTAFFFFELVIQLQQIGLKSILSSLIYFLENPQFFLGTLVDCRYCFLNFLSPLLQTPHHFFYHLLDMLVHLLSLLRHLNLEPPDFVVRNDVKVLLQMLKVLEGRHVFFNL